MNKIQTFQEFLATQSIQVPVLGFVVNLLLAILLSIGLGYIYIKYGFSISNRRMFSRNLVPLSVTTMFVISIVKSSLALSLGLVGALSIVRFRAAIKEPEELVYLFLAIAIGLGLGADQRTITIVAFLIIAILIIIRGLYAKKENYKSLYLTITSFSSEKLSLIQIVEILKKHALNINMKRFDESNELIEATFQIEFSDLENLNQAKETLKQQHEEVKITFIDSKESL